MPDSAESGKLVLQPPMSNACRLDTHKVWTGPRSLAATEGVSDLISIPPGTKMFQFPGLPRHTYVFSVPQPSKLG